MKYFIYVVGCAMNNSDAERISSALQMVGCKKTDKESEADLLIAVACSVRQTAMDRIYSKGQRWKVKRGKTVLTGCVLDADKKKLKDRFDYIFDINNLGDFISELNSKKKIPNSKPCGELDESIKIKNSGDYLNILPQYESTFRAYVPIMTGCNNFCSYCAVPYVRGREKSRPPREVLAEIKDLVARGYKEITLLGQNVNSYNPQGKGQTLLGRKGSDPFAGLIKNIDKIEGDYRVYFYSNHPKDMSDDLISTLPGLKHFPNYIHLPLQSGNNEILKKMNRHYSKESYLELVHKIKKAMPDVAITTDIMVGFPGETKEQFKETREIMESVNFDMAFTAQYSPRPETASARLVDDVPKEEKKKREFELQKVVQAKSSLEHNRGLVGKNVRVLIESKKGDKFFGRTDSYKVVEINQQPSTTNYKLNIGQFYDVEITKAETWKLLGGL